MTAINLDTEIVATRYDAATQTNFYTIERDGKHWTVEIHDDHLHTAARNAPNAIEAKVRRRNHLATVLNQAIQGPPDKEPEASDAA